jgi:hypothetical protein
MLVAIESVSSDIAEVSLFVGMDATIQRAVELSMMRLILASTGVQDK